MLTATATAKSLQLCLTLCDPILGFSRQEHWSGLPFPSPVHKSEKWKWSRSVMSDSLRPHGLQPTRPLRPWNSPGKSTGVGCHCLLHKMRYHTWKSQTTFLNILYIQRQFKIKLICIQYITFRMPEYAINLCLHAYMCLPYLPN